jgi:Na+(H+)/acetate symporter ActP
VRWTVEAIKRRPAVRVVLHSTIANLAVTGMAFLMAVVFAARLAINAGSTKVLKPRLRNM